MTRAQLSSLRSALLRAAMDELIADPKKAEKPAQEPKRGDS